MKRFIGIIVLGLTFTVADAQLEYVPGYMITNEGDSVKGEIKINRKKMYQLNEKVYFKKSEAEKKTYRPNKVKEFGFEGMKYYSMKINDEDTYFLKLLASGPIALYEQKVIVLAMNKEVEKSDYYAQREANDMIYLKPNKFKKQMAELVYDYEELMAEIEGKKFEFDDVEKVIDKYNQWFNEPK